jgi:hypothetical protein
LRFELTRFLKLKHTFSNKVSSEVLGHALKRTPSPNKALF